jgi:hypothetical protein
VPSRMSRPITGTPPADPLATSTFHPFRTFRRRPAFDPLRTFDRGRSH